MNHYFSRLAQRSSIAATNSGRQSQMINAQVANVDSAHADVATINRAAIDATGHAINHEQRRGNGIEAWGEQHIEMASAVYRAEATLEKNEQVTRAAIDNNPGAQLSITSPVSTGVASTLVNTRKNSMQATASELQSGLTQSQSLSAGIPYDAVDASVDTLKNSLPITNYPEQKNTQPIASFSPASVVAPQQRESNNFSGNNIFTEQRLNIPASAQPHRNSMVVDAMQRYTNSIPMSNSNVPGFYDRSATEENQNKRTAARPESETQSASAITSSNGAARVVANTVAAPPGETPTALINILDVAPRSGVQVNIGKIELEIFAPQQNIVQAPQPAAPVIQPARREPVFNPHRYYLRSR
ncbi:MAG: hypothetical protein B0W54_01615 [Cellvibrio sp. 79]|nr:MAG: hypothetical protein B0W54_01615 [Cellvibrio sp. 79]